ncbi:MAG: methylaspartate mutase [Algicola sp.]|nr:methylaspartate mutase [Algicola sp.]
MQSSVFHNYIEKCRKSNQLIVQPRMGFSDIETMSQGLIAVSSHNAATIGTLTIDSYTRVRDFEQAKQAVINKLDLNGYPIVAYSAEENRNMLAGLLSENFPIQVRHGSPQPLEIFQAMLDCGLDATEGGPISYCLPYSRIPLQHSIKAWRESCDLLGQEQQKANIKFHLETFGGCMLGQLCPPSMLITIAILEALFFEKSGIQSISLSFAQGTNLNQDEGAILALRQLANEYLDNKDFHIVLYTFMGQFPTTKQGAKRIIEDSAYLAKRTNIERLIVKTAAEAYHIPTIADNLEALSWAHAANDYSYQTHATEIKAHSDIIYEQAKQLIDTTLNLDTNIDCALLMAFQHGLLDIPYCLHPDNQRQTSTYIDNQGVIHWADKGNLPISKGLTSIFKGRSEHLSSNEFLDMLSFNVNRYDYNLTNRSGL